MATSFDLVLVLYFPPLGSVWNKGTKNTEMEENKGIGKE
jgi:hypothetical protein